MDEIVIEEKPNGEALGNGGKAVAKRSSGAPTRRTKTPAVNGTDQLLAIIERVACDPAADIAKMRELLELRVSLQAAEAKRQFGIAMSAAQEEMEPVRSDCHNKQTHSNYASYPALDRALRPIYTKHGFALTFDTVPGAPDGEVHIICDATHNAGHERRYHLEMSADGKGAKGGDVMTRTHATGAALTYGQRYLLKMIFNIAVENDDDGNKAAKPKEPVKPNEPSGFINDQQTQTVLDLIARVGADTRRFCEFLKIDGVALLPASQYQRAIDALNAFAQQQKQKT